MATTNYISQIRLGGVVYNIKDEEARSATANGVHYRGITDTSALVDGYDGTVSVGGTVLSQVNGDIVLKAFKDAKGNSIHSEFIWNESSGHWDEFGSSGALGGLAFADTASGTTDAINVAILDTHTTYEAATLSTRTACYVTQGSVGASGKINMPTKVTTTFEADDFVTSYPGEIGTLGTMTIQEAGSSVTLHDTPTLNTTTLSTTSIQTVSGSVDISTGLSLDTSVLAKQSINTNYTAETSYLETTNIKVVTGTETIHGTPNFSTTEVIKSYAPVTKTFTTESIYGVQGSTVSVSAVTSATAVDAYTTLTSATLSTLLSTSTIKGVAGSTLSATHLTGIAADASICAIKLDQIAGKDNDYLLNFSGVNVTQVSNIATPATNSTTVVTGASSGSSVIIGGDTTSIRGIGSIINENVAQLATSSITVVTGLEDGGDSVVTELTDGGSVNVYTGVTYAADITVATTNNEEVTVATGSLTTTSDTNAGSSVVTGISSNDSVNVLIPSLVDSTDERRSGINIATGISASGSVAVAQKSGSPTTVVIGLSSGDKVGISLTDGTAHTVSGYKDGKTTVGSGKLADGKASVLVGLGDATTAKALTGDITEYEADITTTSTDINVTGSTSGINVYIPTHSHSIEIGSVNVEVEPDKK